MIRTAILRVLAVRPGTYAGLIETVGVQAGLSRRAVDDVLNAMVREGLLLRARSGNVDDHVFSLSASGLAAYARL